MLLFLTSVDKESRFRDFSCSINNLEMGFDVLSSLTSAGEQIVKAAIIDDNERIQLPLEAFDGDDFSPFIQKLEHEWQRILGLPTEPVGKANQEIVDMLQKQIRNYQTNITQCNTMIRFLEASLERVKLMNCNESKRDILITRYESSLINYYNYLTRITSTQQYVLTRFSQLESA